MPNSSVPCLQAGLANAQGPSSWFWVSEPPPTLVSEECRHLLGFPGVLASLRVMRRVPGKKLPWLFSLDSEELPSLRHGGLTPGGPPGAEGKRGLGKGQKVREPPATPPTCRLMAH